MNKYPAECPFCKKYISPPKETMTEFGNVLSGKCSCGAVYVCDPTGRNVGEAYMEALALAKGDWGIGEISEGSDYRVEEIGYDLKSNVRIYSSSKTEISGKLIFVKLVEKEDADTCFRKDKINKGRIELKGRLRDKVKELLNSKSYEEIADLADIDKSVIRHLISMAYDKESTLAWRAIEAMGFVSKRLSEEKSEIIRDTIRRLLWSMGEESGGIGWSAPELLGEIIRGNPDKYADIIPILWSFKEEEMFRAGVIWAMGRIAELRPELISFIAEELGDMLFDKDPYVRGYVIWVVSILKNKDLFSKLKSLCNDQNSINFYENGELTEIRIDQLIKNKLIYL
jgi:predicted house-cleaning noncanonical NTP pyrophosphatase (MazG superfamily)